MRWQSVAVNHCHDAFGVVLEHQHGWKIVYSGETRVCVCVCMCVYVCMYVCVFTSQHVLLDGVKVSHLNLEAP